MTDLSMYCPSQEDKAGCEAYRKELIHEIKIRCGKVSDNIKLADARRIYAELVNKKCF